MNLKDNLADLTNEEIDTLYSMLETKMQYSRIEKNIDFLSTQAFIVSGVYQGDQWIKPQDAITSYPLNWTVTHKNKHWRSTSHGNLTEPGDLDAHWEEYQPVGGSEPPTEHILALISDNTKPNKT